MSAYFNTTDLAGAELNKSVTAAKNQDAVILELILKNNQPVTPWGLFNTLKKHGFKYLITSVRRSLNTLTNEEHLVKTGNKKMGPQGSKESIWEINEIKYPTGGKQIKLF